MKTVQLQGENLYTQISKAIAISKESKIIAATSVSVTFIEDNKTQKAELLLETKNSLQYKNKTESILCLAGDVLTKRTSRPCLVYCHTQGKIKEFWMTTTEKKRKKKNKTENHEKKTI